MTLLEFSLPVQKHAGAGGGSIPVQKRHNRPEPQREDGCNVTTYWRPFNDLPIDSAGYCKVCGSLPILDIEGSVVAGCKHVASQSEDPMDWEDSARRRLALGHVDERDVPGYCTCGELTKWCEVKPRKWQHTPWVIE